MINRQIIFLIGRVLIFTMVGIIMPPVSAQPVEIKLQIDGATKYQTMDGFGVNINPAWWNNGEYMDTEVMQPAIDLLVDSLGATIFRAVIEEIDWEALNDDDDPDNFNWTYYDSVFTNARFECVWNTLRYLNQKGITNDLIISLMGSPPASLPLAKPDPKQSWMGGTNHTINPAMKNMKLIYTDTTHNLIEGSEIIVSGSSFKASIPAESVFSITGIADSLSSSMTTEKPEPANWYAGDIHIHRNCGEGTSVLSETEFTNMMEPNNLAVISVLADMGDGEVKDSYTDLPKVTGIDAIQSRPGRIVHWDAEWHFDPFGTTFEHKALGGHLILIGLKEAHQIWDESPYKIIEWGKSQNAIVGFCHMEYLNDSIQITLNCCIPVDYPVEAALGTIDFLAEDVWLNDAAINAYYKLLNCGFRLGWAAGTDFPCNNSRPFGSLLTYVQVKDQPMTYQKWIKGIKNGRTVVTTNGHVEFLDLKVNAEASPGDEIKLKDKGSINIEVTWTSIKELTGRIELVCNGKVVAMKEGTAKPGDPVILKTSQELQESSWICARRMDDKGHQSHTAPVYITVDNAPIRASAKDAQYFVGWIDNILVNIETGGPWNHYFTHDLDVVRKRYEQARDIYKMIAIEAKKTHNH